MMKRTRNDIIKDINALLLELTENDRVAAPRKKMPLDIYGGFADRAAIFAFAKGVTVNLPMEFVSIDDVYDPEHAAFTQYKRDDDGEILVHYTDGDGNQLANILVRPMSGKHEDAERILDEICKAIFVADTIAGSLGNHRLGGSDDYSLGGIILDMQSAFDGFSKNSSDFANS